MILKCAKKVLPTLFVLTVSFVSAQSIQHPTIWITTEEKAEILENIDKYEWAKSIVTQLHAHVDEMMKMHLTDPTSILKTIPAFGGNMTAHNAILTLGAESAMLFYLTENEAYAQLSADILAAYFKRLAPLTPQTTEIMGDPFHDGRATYPLIALAYDFVYNYLKKPNTRVYSTELDSRIPFANDAAQKALENIAGNILQEYSGADKHGRRVSNHPILTAPGALYPILCIENDTEREHLFNIFWEIGTRHQASFKNTILPLYSSQGIWPESLSYSFMTNVPMILNIIDRIKPELNVIVENKHILEGSFIFPNLRNPNRTFVRYGDSKRNKSSAAEYYRFIMHMADRRGLINLKHQAEVVLKQQYNEMGGYQPQLTKTVHDYNTPLELFWGMQIPESVTGKFAYKPTVIVKHAGVALQRNFVEKNNEVYGLNGYIGGAHYVHSHVTGIAMELYGASYVMAPNAGLPPTVAERRIPLHENYFRLYAGNNTVIVNGTSHGQQEGSWKGKSHVWQNTTVNVASEPLHLQDPICDKFSFAVQFLKDEVNNCEQERTLSVIRTSEATGYYFDLFRSKSLDENKFHDYIYHNLGDEMSILNAKNKVLDVKETNRYNNDIGDIVHSPGWRYFENTKVTKSTKEAVKVCFHIKYDNRYMHMFLPNGVAREYTKALAPPTREAKNGYTNKKTQVLAIRQQGAAWNRPYIAVFEPSVNSLASVQNIEPLMNGEKVVGAKVVSKVKDTIITDYIIAQDKADAFYYNEALNLTFEGRFGIVRTEDTQGKIKISLYIGEGQELKFGEKSVKGDSQHRAFK